MHPGSGSNRRRYTRFRPEPGTASLAQVDLDLNGPFRPSLVAWVVNQSYTGCCIVLSSVPELQAAGLRLRIRVGLLAPLFGEIRWHSPEERDCLRLGIELSESLELAP